VRALFEAIAIFDWISPAIALFEDFIEAGPLGLDAWTFFISQEQAISRGWSPADVEALLSAHGIKTWGELSLFDNFSFRVKPEQAAWAEYVLARHGVPLLPQSWGAPRSQAHTGGTSQPGAGAVDGAQPGLAGSRAREGAKQVKADNPLNRITSFLDDLHEDRI
jgi:hypothetical protein